MRPEARKYLHDIVEAGERIASFTLGKTLEDYELDVLLRSAVERQFEIIGEALAQLAHLDEAAAAQISEHRRIISFRNILIHGYTQVDDRIVWDIVQPKLPGLRRDVAELLDTIRQAGDQALFVEAARSRRGDK